MSKHPAPWQLTALVDHLRSLDLDDVERQLAQAIALENRCGTTRPDGFRHRDPADVACDLAMGHYAPDPHHEAVKAGVRALEDAVVAINRLRTALAAVANSRRMAA